MSRLNLLALQYEQQVQQSKMRAKNALSLASYKITKEFFVQRF